MTDNGVTASTNDLVGWRMRALGLWQSLPGTATHSGTGSERIAAVAKSLLALQGQDTGASRWALGLRAAGTVNSDVSTAFDSGAIVRSWPMRGTIHIVAAEDIGWMQAATNHRILPSAEKRRDVLGIDTATLTRMVDVAVASLSGGNSLSRDELAEAWTAAGIGGSEQGIGPWRYHLVWWMCQNGITVAGPTCGGAEPRLVLADEWITAPRHVSGEEALIELATRYARGRGPVQVRDFAWWTGLTVREAKLAIAAAVDAGRLTGVRVEDTAYWAEPSLLAEPTHMPHGAPTMLLPGFDEHLLGYTDRSAVLDPAHFNQIVPGRNGVFRGTVVSNGKTVGVWMKRQRANETQIEVAAFSGEKIPRDSLEVAASAWGLFRGEHPVIEAVA